MQNKGALLYQKAKKIIPGGTQLLSKRPERFLPGYWPAYYKKCKGIYVWGLDNKKYMDFSISGVGACALGYADEHVDAAVKKAVKNGNMCTLNSPEEVELAELLCAIHPWAQMVRYARCGGEAMAVAVRIIRAYSGKEKILFCGYHGWHDWYLSANLAESSALDGQLLPGLEPKGVPRGLMGSAFPFKYNDLNSFKNLINKFGEELAGVVMEPVRNFWPKAGFLEEIRRITGEKGIPLVFDEVTTGFKMTCGGIHLKLKVTPDLAVFAKSLGNGYPMAAIIGKAHIMNAAQETFISSTYWTDRIGPAAALASIKKHRSRKVCEHLIKIGNLAQEGWRKLGVKYGLPVKITGIAPLGYWEIASPDSALAHTLIVKMMLEKGFLTSKAFYPTYCHRREDVKKYLGALDAVLKQISENIKNNTLSKIYSGPAANPGFKRVT